MKSNELSFGAIAPFNFSVKYSELKSSSPLNVNDSHVHAECEIYVNVSGDVAFAVEGNVYPVSSGNAIVTRPSEFHHCIYRSDALHRHYWILFSSRGNERLFDAFFNRKAGQRNLHAFQGAEKEKLFEICERMIKGTENEAERYCLFFRLISLLNGDNAINSTIEKSDDPLLNAMNFIDKNFCFDLSVRQVAEECHVSVNTLERRFTAALRLSPREYIKKKRLANALTLLSEGSSVSDAALQSGFSDVSAFIVLFKKTYSITPLQYKKSFEIAERKNPS